MAERYGSDLRLLLRSAERLREAAMRFGSLSVKTPRSRSSASLFWVTRCDQRRPVAALARLPLDRRAFDRVVFRRAARLAMVLPWGRKTIMGQLMNCRCVPGAKKRHRAPRSGGFLRARWSARVRVGRATLPAHILHRVDYELPRVIRRSSCS